MKSHHPLQTLLCLAVLSAVMAGAVAVAHAEQELGVEETELLERRAVRDAERSLERGRYGAFRAIQDAFPRLPMSFEENYTSQESIERGIPDATFVVEAGETLGEVFRRFLKVTEGRFQVFKEDGILYVAPVEGEETNLDRVIDLRVEDASVWEALKALEEAVNANPRPGRYLTVYPPGIEVLQLPPEPFHERAEITLNLEGVTAREALVRILAESSLRMAYNYKFGLRYDLIRIWIYDQDGRQIAPGGREMSSVDAADKAMEWNEKTFHVRDLPPETEIEIHGPDGPETTTVGEHIR